MFLSIRESRYIDFRIYIVIENNYTKAKLLYKYIMNEYDCIALMK